jgi:hypothetical protein
MQFWLWTMAYVPHLATLSSEKTEQDLMDALLVTNHSITLLNNVPWRAPKGMPYTKDTKRCIQIS